MHSEWKSTKFKFNLSKPNLAKQVPTSDLVLGMIQMMWHNSSGPAGCELRPQKKARVSLWRYCYCFLSSLSHPAITQVSMSIQKGRISINPGIMRKPLEATGLSCGCLVFLLWPFLWKSLQTEHTEGRLAQSIKQITTEQFDNTRK